MNINLLPIDYAFLPRLRGRLTLRRLTLRKDTLRFRRAGFSPALSLLMSAFALSIPPAHFSIHFHRLTDRSSPDIGRASCRERVCRLVYISGVPSQITQQSH